MASKIRLFGLLMAAMMLASLASCVTITKNPTGASVAEGEETSDEEDISSAIADVESLASEEGNVPSAPESDAGLPTKTVTEGELVNFPNLKATDPDGDKIIYTFSKPLSANGEWQTQKGDEGRYKASIVASDGVNRVSQDVIIIVLPSNKAPLIEGLSDITVNEGETVKLSPVVTDPEGGEVTVTYSGWMLSSARETNYDDAGSHAVKVTATDGEEESEKSITVTVLNVNRQPSLSVADVTVVEGETASADAIASDPDGDEMSVTFSEPLSNKGAWETKVGDAGKYRVTATVSDGAGEVTKSFFVIVTPKNKAPALSGVADIEADEGDAIQLSITATDEDGDKVTITYPAPFDSAGKWATGYTDAGTYTLKVSATDGISTTEEPFTVVVNDVNRAPAFGEGAFN